MVKIKDRKFINPSANFPIFFMGLLITLLLSNIIPAAKVECKYWWEYILYFIFKDTFIPDIKFVYILLFIWFEWIIIYSSYQPIIENKKAHIDRMDAEIKELKNDMKNEAGILLSRYSDLTKFKIKDILQDNIKRFIDGRDIIQAAQIYKYTLVTNNESTNIKVEFSGGYVKEDICINSIMQSYYKVPAYILEKLSIIMGLYHYLENDVNEEVELLIYDVFNNIDKIAKEIIIDIKQNLIDKKSNDGFDDNDADLYAVLNTTIKLLYEDDYDEEISEGNEYKARVISEIFTEEFSEKELATKKRTGILESILTQDYSIFQHEGDNDKNGRAYVSKCISLNGEKYVLMLIADSSISSELQWKDKLLELSCQLEDMLKISFKEI